MRESDLYIIQSAVTGSIKIGRSIHVHKRLKQLQTGCPYKLRLLLHVKKGGDQERKLHRLLSHCRIRWNGEWFEVEGLADLPVNLYEQLDLEEQDWWKDPQYKPI